MYSPIADCKGPGDDSPIKQKTKNKKNPKQNFSEYGPDLLVGYEITTSIEKETKKEIGENRKYQSVFIV